MPIWGIRGFLGKRASRTLGHKPLVFFCLAIGRGEASRIVTITALYPVVSFVPAVLILREPVTWTKAAGTVLTVGGLILLAIWRLYATEIKDSLPRPVFPVCALHARPRRSRSTGLRHGKKNETAR